MCCNGTFISAALAMALAAASASAGVGIAWSTCSGAYDHLATDLTGYEHALLDSYGATWQLVYAGPNNRIDPPGFKDGYASADDVVLAQRNIPLGGGSGNDAPHNTTWDNWMRNTGGDVVYEDLAWFMEGYVYQRVYEGAPPSGDCWWHDTELFAMDTSYAGGEQPQVFTVDSFDAGFQPDQHFPYLEEPLMTIDPSSTNFTSSSWSGRTITVSGNTMWSAETDVEWLEVTDGSWGSLSGTVTFNVAANAGASARTGEVRVISGDFFPIIRTCTVVQAGVAARPQAQADGYFGVISNRFGFNVNWTSGRVVVVDGCTNLANPAWVPLQTNTLTGSPVYFSDPRWTNFIGRYYRIRAP